MVRFAVATMILAVLTCSPLFAQGAAPREVSPQEPTPKVQVFGGGVIFHADPAGLNPISIGLGLHEPSSPFGVTTFFYGWEAQAQYNATRWVGIAVDFGGRSGPPFTATGGITGLPNLTTHSLLAGPVISYRTKSIFTPYVHALFGWERTSLSASTITGPITAPATSAGTTYNDVVMALGGGLDCRVVRRLAVRLAQVDWYHTSINQNLFYGSAYGPDRFLTLGNHENNVRISTGIVVKF
jgi:opacity protein-like surface antigen